MAERVAIQFTRGMRVGPPAALTPPDVSEQWFNWLYDRTGRLRRRPGSLFGAHLGTGAILGLYEHTFQYANVPPKLVAIVQAPHSEAQVTVDPPSSWGPAGYETGVYADVKAGALPLSFPALESDRFTFASLYDTLFWAGSSVDPYVFAYDYSPLNIRILNKADDTGELLKAKGCIAYKNRLWIYGGPDHPNRLTPSNFGEPEKLQARLGVDFGSTASEILRVLEISDALVLLTKRGLFVFNGDSPELGEVGTDTGDPDAEVAGVNAACIAPDGFVYMLDPRRGPLRWRLGMTTADDQFAVPMLPVFRRLNVAKLASTVVAYDVERDNVHFMVPLYGDTPDYIVSYSLTMGEWTHGASTQDLRLVGAEPVTGGHTRLHTTQGIRAYPFPTTGKPTAPKPLYTAMIPWRDTTLGKLEILCGDESGYIWRLEHGARDKFRGDTERPGYSFTSLWRSGAVELAPLGFRAMIHRMILDMDAPGDWTALLRIEHDFDRFFRYSQTLLADDYTGELTNDFVFPDPAANPPVVGSLLSRAEPWTLQVPAELWGDALGKVLRFELQTTDDLTLAGLEFERSQSAIKI